MEWIKKNPEKLILLIAALICIGLGVKHVLSAKGLPAEFIVSERPPKNNFPHPPNIDVIRSGSLLEAGFFWTDKIVKLASGAQKPVTLFRSVWIIEKDGELYDITDPNERKLRPPVSNEWLLENDLEFLSSGVLEADPDNDGFTSVEEWHADTSPVLKDSHPPYLHKLLFVERKQRSFALRYGARNNTTEGEEFQINVIDRGRRKSERALVGQMFYGGRFTILGHTEKEGKNRSGIQTDQSELEVRDERSGRTVILVKGENTLWPTFFAEFNFTLDPAQAQFYVREGDSFALNVDPNNAFRLLEVTEDTATVEPQEGGDPVKLTRGAMLALPVRED